MRTRVINLRNWVLVFALAWAVLGLAACGGGSGGGGEEDTEVTMRLSLSSGERAAPADVVMIVFTVTGPDMNTLVQTFPNIGQDTIEAVFFVPNGEDRVFTVEGLDSNGWPFYRGHETQDVTGQPLSLSLTMTGVRLQSPAMSGTYDADDSFYTSWQTSNAEAGDMMRISLVKGNLNRTMTSYTFTDQVAAWFGMYEDVIPFNLEPGSDWRFEVRHVASGAYQRSVAQTMLGGETPGWRLTSQLPIRRVLGAGAAPGNGYVYLVNGYSATGTIGSGLADGRVFVAEQNTDGSLGAWSETADMDKRSGPGVVVYNGRIYVVGGALNTLIYDQFVQYAKPNADGTINGWTMSSSLMGANVGRWPSVAANNGYMYILGGWFAPGVETDDLWRASIQANGELLTWTNIGTFSTYFSRSPALFYNDILYLVLNDSSLVYRAVQNPDGSLQSWQLCTGQLPVTMENPSAQFFGGRLYVIPGGKNVYSAAVLPTGDLGAFRAEDPMPEISYAFNADAKGGKYWYVMGDHSLSVSLDKFRRVYYRRME